MIGYGTSLIQHRYRQASRESVKINSHWLARLIGRPKQVLEVTECGLRVITKRIQQGFEYENVQTLSTESGRFFDSVRLETVAGASKVTWLRAPDAASAVATATTTSSRRHWISMAAQANYSPHRHCFCTPFPRSTFKLHSIPRTFETPGADRRSPMYGAGERVVEDQHGISRQGGARLLTAVSGQSMAECGR